jgi:sugar O-acyltransferase (sialic acid O-acetyltransferase NeuD family)
MRRSLVIFGTGEIAQIAHHYFTKDSDYAVVGFSIDSSYINEDKFCGLPVVAFEDVSQTFSAESNEFFIALGYSKLNALRRDKFMHVKARGYKTATYISSRATLLENVKLGENCFILEDNTIQPFVSIGNNVTLWSGNHIGHHSVIRDHSFVSSHVVVSGGVDIGEQCFVGVNATLRDHIKVGDRCIVGAGALLLSDAQPDGVYIGSATERSKVPSSRLKRI